MLIMKRIYLIFLLGFLAGVANSPAQPITSGNYRIPYADGLLLTALVDHVTHSLSNRVDLQGIDPSTSNYVIVAVADGWIRRIRDGFGGVNYVWIEHPNGEWSGYFYMRAGSVQLGFNLSQGDFVTNGQPIGVEGTVGSPGGSSRLRFEVGVPDDANDPIGASGLLKGENRLPVICNTPDNDLRVGNPYTAAPCVAQEFSYGVYRLPYTNGVHVFFNRDHLTHAPSKTRLDLNGIGNPGNYAIVAAASGIIMRIVDGNTVTNCTGSNGCAGFNNYVWIAHANGEWTKYTHFRTGSVRNRANLTEGQYVTAGTYLGDEGAVGFAFGQHLHFEVGFPFNTNNAIQVDGGFLTNGVNRIPLFCDVPGNIGYQGDDFWAGPCSGGGCTASILLPGGTIRGTKAYIAGETVDSNNSVMRVDTYGSLALMAGNKITLRPGFSASSSSYVHASLRPCNAPP